MNTTINNHLPNVLDLNTLVGMAGTNIPPILVKFEEDIYDGTLQHKDDPEAAVEGMKDAIMSDYEVVVRTEEYTGYTMAEMEVALVEALQRLPYGKSVMVNINGKTAVTKQIDIGFKDGVMQTKIVADGESDTANSLPGFIPLGKKSPAWVTVRWSPVGCVLVARVRRRDQAPVSGLFEFVRRWADTHSIYIGQCIDTSYNFLDLSKFRVDRVAMTDEIKGAVDRYVRGPLSRMERIIREGLSTKTGILYEGPPGTGKTMIVTACEREAIDAGATVIRIPAGSGLDGVKVADRIGKRLMKAGFLVMWTMEDVETLSKADRSKTLDILDGGGAKTDRRIFLATTNDLDMLEEAFKRPGRWNAIMSCYLPDLSAFRQLVEIMLEGKLAPEIDWEHAFKGYEGYTYAFIANSVDAILRNAINRDIDPVLVTTDDIYDAGMEQRGYYDKLQREQVVPKPALDEVMREMVMNQLAEAADEFVYSVHDATNYDYIERKVDEVVENRLSGATIDLSDADGNEISGGLYTN